jgi:hypothetical protein
MNSNTGLYSRQIYQTKIVGFYIKTKRELRRKAPQLSFGFYVATSDTLAFMWFNLL